MKLKDEGRFFEASGESVDLQLSSKDGAVIMKMLRSQIYSNPIGSLVREVASNCRDANREAGKPNGLIRITLSKNSNPFLQIDSSVTFEDEGFGISPSRMREVYSQYGASTKRNDDSQTGGFGLGAKSPFAYTETFFIVTVIDGIEYSYQAALNDSGGKIVLLSSGQTEKASGTKIIVPIADKDHDQFRREIADLVKYWKEEVELCGNFREQDRKRPIVLLETDDYVVYDDSMRHCIIVDGIVYEREGYGSNRKTLKFAVGELSLTASREGVHFDENTSSLISEKEDSANRNLQRDVEQKIAGMEPLAVAQLLHRLKVNYVINGEDIFAYRGVNIPGDAALNRFRVGRRNYEVGHISAYQLAANGLPDVYVYRSEKELVKLKKFMQSEDIYAVCLIEPVDGDATKPSKQDYESSLATLDMLRLMGAEITEASTVKLEPVKRNKLAGKMVRAKEYCSRTRDLSGTTDLRVDTSTDNISTDGGRTWRHVKNQGDCPAYLVVGYYSSDFVRKLQRYTKKDGLRMYSVSQEDADSLWAKYPELSIRELVRDDKKLHEEMLTYTSCRNSDASVMHKLIEYGCSDPVLKRFKENCEWQDMCYYLKEYIDKDALDKSAAEDIRLFMGRYPLLFVGQDRDTVLEYVKMVDDRLAAEKEGGARDGKGV